MSSKPKKTQKETPTESQERDGFLTPKYGTDLLIPFIPKKIKTIWECAGAGLKITNRLKEYNYNVITSDIKIIDPVYIAYYNFLDENVNFNFDCIITNPPYSLKEKFYKKCLEYEKPFALLIPADYSGWIIDAIRNDSAEKIIPTRRINYITPNICKNVWMGETKKLIEKEIGLKYKNFVEIPEFLWKRYENRIVKYDTYRDIPIDLMVKYSAAQFHSMWLTYGFNLGKSENFVDLTKDMMYNI